MSVVDTPDLPGWVRPGSLATIDALELLRKEPEIDGSFLAPSAQLHPGTRTGRFRLGKDHLLVGRRKRSKPYLGPRLCSGHDR
jgi:uncharacterized protein